MVRSRREGNRMGQGWAKQARPLGCNILDGFDPAVRLGEGPSWVSLWGGLAHLFLRRALEVRAGTPSRRRDGYLVASWILMFFERLELFCR